VQISRGERLCLALYATPGGIQDPPVPSRYTLSGLCDVVGSDGRTRALDVLTDLEDLVDEGLVREETRSVTGIDEERRVFGLTDAGRRQASQLRRDLVDEPVTVRHDGSEATIRLGDVGEYLDAELPLVRALVDLEEQGLVDADQHRPGEQFVGRDRILGLFEKTAWQSTDGSAGLVLRGPTGVGKTAITRECARIARSTGGQVVTGRTPRAGGAAYAALRDVCAQLDGGSTPFESISPPTDRMDAEEYQSMRLSLFYDVYKHLEAAAEEQPTLVVLRDMQWARRGTLDLLSFLAPRIEDLPLTVLCTVNTVFQDETTTLLDRLDETVSEGTFVPVDVEPLARSELDPLVCWQLEVETVPGEFVDAIYEHTGGNPAFVTTLLDHLQETDRIDPDSGTFPTASEDLTLPEGARTVVESRLDRLDDDQRTVLEAAAVVGERAALPVLARMTSHSEAALRPIAEQIAGTALWEPSKTPTVPLSRTYEFQSPLVRQAVRQGIDEDRRRRLHERAAEAVRSVTLTPGRLSAAVAARHYEDADLPGRALGAYQDAGDRARENYAHDDAAEYYERALELATALDRSHVELDLLEALSRTQYCTGNAEGARAHLDQLLEQADDPERIQRAELSRWRMAKDCGDFESADEHARAGIEALSDPTKLSCRFWGKLGWTQLQRGEIDAAAEQFYREQEVAEQLADDECYGTVYYHRAELARARGDPEQAIELVERAIHYHELAGSARDAAKSHMLLGILHSDRAEIDEAEAAYEASLERIREIGDRVLEVYLDANRAKCPLDRGEWDEAVERHEKTLETARTLDQRRVTTRLLSNSSIIYAHRGQLSTARERATEALETAREIQEVTAIALAQCQLARIETLEGTLEAAKEEALQARELATDAAPGLAAEAEYHLGTTALAAEDPETALEHFRQSHTLATDCDSTEWRCRAAAGCATALARIDRPEDALERARAMVETANDLGDPEAMVRTHLALARSHAAADEIGEALTAIETALETVRDLDAPLLESRTLLEAGRLDRTRDPPRANRRLTRALDLVEPTGATLLEDRCRDALDALDRVQT
jgi:predicted ATPase